MDRAAEILGVLLLPLGGVALIVFRDKRIVVGRILAVCLCLDAISFMTLMVFQWGMDAVGSDVPVSLSGAVIVALIITLTMVPFFAFVVGLWRARLWAFVVTGVVAAAATGLAMYSLFDGQTRFFAFVGLSLWVPTLVVSAGLVRDAFAARRTP